MDFGNSKQSFKGFCQISLICVGYFASVVESTQSFSSNSNGFHFELSSL
jgi:hypothetical protein